MWSLNRILEPLLVASLLMLLVAGSSAAQGESPESALVGALAALEAGDIARARELLEAMVTKWPKHRRAHYHLGRLAFDRGDLDDASRHLEMAAVGDFPRAFSVWYYLGRTRLLRRDFAGAVEALDGALERAPSFAPALMERGRARLVLGETEAGLADLLQTLETAEPPRQASVLTGQLLMALGRSDEALSVVQALSDRSEGEDRWLRRARWLLLALEPGLGSQAELARAVEENPEAGDLYWALGMVHLETDPERSVSLFRVSLDQDSENPVSVLSLEQLAGDNEPVTLPAALPNLRPALARARRLWEEGRYDEGREIAQRLLEKRPRLVPALLLLARDAERRDDLWRALAIYEQLLDWLGPIPSVGLNLAEVAQTMGAQDLAVCGVQVAQDGDPNDGSLYHLIGVIEADRGNTEAAIEAHARALELGYEDVRTWLRLGELHFEQMNITESIAAYEKAMAMEPAAAEAVRSFALSSLTTEQYASLRDVLEVHIQEHPESINTLYSLGIMSLRDNRLDAAKEYFLTLAKVAPDHRQVHYNLGQILLRQGDTVAGQAEMEKFREIRAAEDQKWEEHNQAHFRRVEARKSMEAGRPEEAIPLYAQSVAEETAELSDFLELATANLAAGRVADALKGYEGILSSYPYHRPALEGMLEATTALGDERRREDARRKLELLDWPCKMTTIENRGDS